MLCIALIVYRGIVTLVLYIYIYIYIYMCVCVCVCVVPQRTVSTGLLLF